MLEKHWRHLYALIFTWPKRPDQSSVLVRESQYRRIEFAYPRLYLQTRQRFSFFIKRSFSIIDFITFQFIRRIKYLLDCLQLYGLTKNVGKCISKVLTSPLIR